MQRLDPLPCFRVSHVVAATRRGPALRRDWTTRRHRLYGYGWRAPCSPRVLLGVHDLQLRQPDKADGGCRMRFPQTFSATLPLFLGLGAMGKTDAAPIDQLQRLFGFSQAAHVRQVGAQAPNNLN